MQFLPRIKQSTDAVINVTTGGGHGMTLAERLEGPMRARPEMCSLNMGSMNFGLYPMLDRYPDFKYEWERTHLENSRDFIFRNTFMDIEYILKELGEGCGTRFEFECYDVGHLYNLAHFLDRGLVRPPLFVQTIFGILGGIGADHENLMHMKRIADRLFGSDYQWSVLAAGRHQLGFVSMAAMMGGNIRVGLEDSLYASKGRLATSNAEQVSIVRSIIENLSMEGRKRGRSPGDACAQGRRSGRVLTGIITLLVSRRLIDAVRRRLRRVRHRMPEGLWASLFAAVSLAILDHLILPARTDKALSEVSPCRGSGVALGGALHGA